MAISQLSLYNEALRLLGERSLLSLTEERVSRRVMDNIWNDGIVNYCLEAGPWKFALRAVEIPKLDTVTPVFGYTYAFDKPADWLRTAGISGEETMQTPLLDYAEEVGYWFANVNPLYARYVSNDANYGSLFSRWPPTFAKYVAAIMAFEAAPTLAPEKAVIDRVYATITQRLKLARSADALGGPTSYLPTGSWTRARLGGNGNDRGNRGSLIG